MRTMVNFSLIELLLRLFMPISFKLFFSLHFFNFWNLIFIFFSVIPTFLAISSSFIITSTFSTFLNNLQIPVIKFYYLHVLLHSIVTITLLPLCSPSFFCFHIASYRFYYYICCHTASSRSTFFSHNRSIALCICHFLSTLVSCFCVQMIGSRVVLVLLLSVIVHHVTDAGRFRSLVQQGGRVKRSSHLCGSQLTDMLERVCGAAGIYGGKRKRLTQGCYHFHNHPCRHLYHSLSLIES